MLHWRATTRNGDDFVSGDIITTFVAQPFESDAAVAFVTDAGSPTTVCQSDTDPITSATINADDISSFPTSGGFWIYLTTTSTWVFVEYTGVDLGGGVGNHQFTGCTTTGTGDTSLGDTIMASRSVTLAALWLIHRLAPTSAAGTSDEDAKEFGAYMQAQIRGAGTLWTVVLLQSGLYELAYTSTGPAFVVRSTSGRWAAELGLASTTIAFTGADSVTASYAPNHCIMSAYRPVPVDGDYQPRIGFMAISRMQNGRVDVLSSNRAIVDRMFGLSDHPRTPTDRTTRGTVCTPMGPDDDDHASWNEPTAAMDSTPGRWTIHRSVLTGMGLQLGYTLGQFQQLTGASPAIRWFVFGYWSEQVLKSKVAIFSPPLFSVSKRDGLELTRLVTAGTTT